MCCHKKPFGTFILEVAWQYNKFKVLNFASTQIVVLMSDRLTFPNLENERAKALNHLKNGNANQVKLFNATFNYLYLSIEI